MADPAEEKRRALIMAMAKDMGRGKEFPAQSTGFRTPEAKMSQGDPPPDKPLEDTFQADDLVLGMVKPMAKALAKPAMAAMAGKGGNALFKAAGPMHMSSTTVKTAGPMSDTEAKWARIMRNETADVRPASVPSSQHETMWMDEAFARQMGKGVDPSWQKFIDDPTMVTGKKSDWLEVATARPQQSFPPSAQSTTWMREDFAKQMGVASDPAWTEWVNTPGAPRQKSGGNVLFPTEAERAAGPVSFWTPGGPRAWDEGPTLKRKPGEIPEMENWWDDERAMKKKAQSATQAPPQEVTRKLKK